MKKGAHICDFPKGEFYEYKHHDYVTGKDEVGALPEDMEMELSELFNEMQGISIKDILVASAYFHAKFENIHPFADGNGRTGRLAMNYLLVTHNHPPIIIHAEDKKNITRHLKPLILASLLTNLFLTSNRRQ